MRLKNTPTRFENAIAPHLDAAYNLARWLTKNDHDAEDIVQEASLRAFQYFTGYRGGDSGAWLLRIVRNTFYTWLQKRPREDQMGMTDNVLERAAAPESTPEEVVLEKIDHARLRAAIEALPDEFREVLILRDLEDLSYKEIAGIVDAPIGTVMSRLSRARRKVAESLTKEGCTDEL